MPPPLNRRAFLGTTAAAATLTGVLAGTAPQASAATLRAAVLEFLDPWTNAIGLASQLRAAGMEVVDLDPAKPATEQGVDLIAFGTFTNNDSVYLDYVAAHADSIGAFVVAGGVVAEFAQSDQFGAAVKYLPAPMSAIRADPDHATVYAFDREHVLVAPLRRLTTGQVFAGRTGFPVSYETLTDWTEMRVLISGSATASPPVLVEGAHGPGRFLVASLTVDKVHNAAGEPIQSVEALAESAAFFGALAGYVGSVKDGTAPAVVPTAPPKEVFTGPLVGHVTAHSGRVLIRPGREDRGYAEWELRAKPSRGAVRVARVTVSEDHDGSAIFDIAQLVPATRYEFTVAPVGVPDYTPVRGSFTTGPVDRMPSKIVLGMGSCAQSVENSLWDRVISEGCEAFVLLGDTPYIDSTDVAVARRKHRQFLQVPSVSRVVSSMPVWGTWDDHDFALNDSHGDTIGKEHNRQAFVDYRANATYGHGADGRQLTERTEGEGIYTSFRRGPIEVFVVDPRWFSRTAPSWADPDQPTCIGEVQWRWLQRGLKASTAPFKMIATGMIWDDKENGEKDDWFTYKHEREAIFDFVRDQKISGVMLAGGDIHVSRALNYGPRVGYPLWQFIVSPIHGSTIPSLNVPHPNLVHSAVEPHVFLKIEADSTVSPATLTATWINRDGVRIFEVNLDSDMLSA